MTKTVSKPSKNVSAQKKTMKLKNELSHGQKIAKSRGLKWKKSLSRGKIEAAKNPTAIRLARLKLNLGQDILAKKISVAESSFGEIERARRPVRADRAKKISSLLKVPLNKLFKPTKNSRFIAIK